MHQNLAVILQQLIYSQNSFIVLIPVLFFHLVLVAGRAEDLSSLADHGPQGVELTLAVAAIETVLGRCG